MELILAACLDALTDSMKLLPFLYLACLMIEAIERSKGTAIESVLSKGGKWGFLAGGALGCIPQCGFSAMAADLYASRVISLGTMMAVFVATSDEAIPLLISMPEYWLQLATLLACKLIFAVLVGFILDVALRKVLPYSLRGGYKGSAADVDCFEEHEEESTIWLAALRHAMEIFIFVLLFSVVMGVCIEMVGQQAVADALSGLGVLQPFLASLIGLIPNCAASILMIQLYLAGSLPFSSAVAGLCSGAGVGLAVLFRVNRSIKQNLFIAGVLWLFGAFAGLLLSLLGM